eukprot:NODE_468_length_8097_cov_0.251813.p7 type:complete len:171 gc:universal NODE_468_length_8097_cov_0.251813:6647-6135(-)
MIVGIMSKILQNNQLDQSHEQKDEVDIGSNKFCVTPKKKIDITKLPKKLQPSLKTKKLDVLEDWYDLPLQKITTEIKHDLLALKSRSALNPKRHFKKESKSLPTYFHMGVIVEPKAEFYSHRLTKKMRKSNLFDEMLMAPDTQVYLKKKCYEIHERNKKNSTYRKNKNRH